MIMEINEKITYYTKLFMTYQLDMDIYDTLKSHVVICFLLSCNIYQYDIVVY